MNMFNRGAGFKTEKAEVVRIKVKKCDGLMQPEYKKLCVDPQLTSYDIMRNLLARAFNIKSEFMISYLSRDDKGQEVYLSLLSDWDLDAAFLGSSDPYLRLKVDLKPFEEGLEDWDIVGDQNSQAQKGTGRALLQDSAALIGTLTGSITSQVGKTVTQVSKAMGLWSEEQKPAQPIKPCMTDQEFHNFMDGVGHMIQPGEFRLSVFRGGVEPALRKVVWRHLLNIFPENLSGKERFSYLQGKVREYYKLREEWRAFFIKGEASEEIRMVANMVKKDVLRTDRMHKYYAGADDNKNVLSLFNLLVTYAVTHPDVLYCQGMSDLASPILLVQDDEAYAYLCFCGLMKRLKSNFTVDGLAMTSKFQHLSLLLQHHDPDFFAYLKEHNADDMFFCFRWLLLELKREFPLDDTLYMLEIMWSSLPPDPPQDELPLIDPEYQKAGILVSPSSPTMASVVQAYVLLRSRLRKAESESSSNSLSTSDASDNSKNGVIPADVITPCEDKPINPKDFTKIEDTASAEILRSKAALIEKALKGEEVDYEEVLLNGTDVDSGERDHLPESSDSSPTQPPSDDAKEQEQQDCRPITSVTTEEVNLPEKMKSQVQISVSTEQGREINDIILEEHPESHSPDTSSTSPKRPADIPIKPNTLTSQLKTGTQDVSSCEEAMENLSIDYIKVNQKLPKLPSPAEFGHGNPFSMFLCLTLLVQHRDHIMANRMDYNDLAMHFDKMVRKHDVHRVVLQARSLYMNYLKGAQSNDSTIASDTPSSDDVSV